MARPGKADCGVEVALAGAGAVVSTEGLDATLFRTLPPSQSSARCTFWLTKRTLFSRLKARKLFALEANQGPVGVEADSLGRALGDSADEALLGQDQREIGVGHHEAEALAGIGGIERDIGPAGLEHGERAHHHIEGALHQDADEGASADAAPLQVTSELIAPAIELAIREREALERDRDGPGRALDLRLEELHDRAITRIPTRPRPIFRSAG